MPQSPVEYFVSYQKSGNVDQGMSDVGDQPLYIARFNVTDLPSNTGGSPDGVRATECALWWCLQAYRITVNSTQQLQTTIRTWSQRKPTGEDGNPSGIEFKNVPQEFNVVPGTTYGISKMALRGLQAGFDGLFRGSVRGSPRVGYSYNGAMIQSIKSGSQDMDKFINNIAKSMTNGLRTQAPADNATTSYYAGTAYSMQTYKHVRWAWIALPAATVVGSCFFLLAIMWQSKRHGVHGWKDSALALLFSSVTTNLVKKRKGGLDQPDELMKKVGSEKVILREDGEQWLFEAS